LGHHNPTPASRQTGSWWGKGNACLYRGFSCFPRETPGWMLFGTAPWGTTKVEKPKPAGRFSAGWGGTVFWPGDSVFGKGWMSQLLRGDMLAGGPTAGFGKRTSEICSKKTHQGDLSLSSRVFPGQFSNPPGGGFDGRSRRFSVKNTGTGIGLAC